MRGAASRPPLTMDWRDKKLAICVTANQDKIDANFTWTLLNMYKPKRFAILHEGQHIKSNSLNRLVDRGLEFGADKFLFLDVDMEFPANTIPQLLTHDVPIVGGLYYIKSYPYSPIAGLVAKNNLRVNMKGKPWKENYAPLPENQLVEVGWTGIGCLMVDRKIFETLPLPCFKDIWDTKRGQRKKGHDILFCENAIKAGFKVYIDTSVDCTHRQVIGINKLYVESYHESGMEEKMVQKIQQWSSESAWWDEKWLEAKVRRKEQIHLQEMKYMIKNVPEGVSVGDLGCGSGFMLQKLQTEKKCTGYGYDFSQMAIDILKSRDLNGEVCDVRNFVPNTTYHTVICSHLLEHVEDERKLIEIVSKMTEYQAFISVPIEEIMWIEHKRMYNKRSLAKLLKPYFEEVIVKKVGFDLLAHCFKKERTEEELVEKAFKIAEDMKKSADGAKRIAEIKRRGPSDPMWWDFKYEVYGKEGAIIDRTTLNEIFLKNIPKNVRVADFGCGYSSTLVNLKETNKCDCYAYDFSPKAIELMKGIGIDGEVADILTFNPNGTRYHTVILSHLLEHFDKKETKKVLKTISEMAEKQVIVVVPQEKLEGMGETTRKILEREHKKIYTPEELEMTLKPYFGKIEIIKIKPKEKDKAMWTHRHLIGICESKHSAESDEVRAENRVSVGAVSQ